jgi:TatD DNase family protein
LQEEMFRWQLRLAAERNLPVSIHCLKAWGRLDQVLREEPLPNCGFLLHSYGGPAEMIDGFARLGAYFSLSGYLAHERKARQRTVFQQVPVERLLIETDAPDMAPPESLTRHPLTDPGTGRPVNHPANLKSVYEFAAELFQTPIAPFTEQVGKNFNRLFGGS